MTGLVGDTPRDTRCTYGEVRCREVCGLWRLEPVWRVRRVTSVTAGEPPRARRRMHDAHGALQLYKSLTLPQRVSNRSAERET